MNSQQYWCCVPVCARVCLCVPVCACVYPCGSVVPWGWLCGCVAVWLCGCGGLCVPVYACVWLCGLPYLYNKDGGCMMKPSSSVVGSVNLGFLARGLAGVLISSSPA